jgi:ribosome-binding factor A
MAQGRRVERMAALIRREVSELLINGIKDERVHNGMVSITHADVAGDLQHCRIFVSVLGSEEDRQLVLDGLKAAAPYVKGELGRRLKMRRTPEVVFLLDKGLERGTTVLGLLGRLETERISRGEVPEGTGTEGTDMEGEGEDKGLAPGADSGATTSAVTAVGAEAESLNASLEGRHEAEPPGSGAAAGAQTHGD